MIAGGAGQAVFRIVSKAVMGANGLHIAVGVVRDVLACGTRVLVKAVDRVAPFEVTITGV